MRVKFFEKIIVGVLITLLVVPNLVACENNKGSAYKKESTTYVKESTSDVSELGETVTKESEAIAESTKYYESEDTYETSADTIELDDDENFKYPRVDGSTANMPLMAQIRSDYLNEPLVVSQNNTKVTTTDYAWRSLIDGKADLLLVYEASSETKKIIEDSDVELKITPIGVDALVFIENEGNPVNNLSTEQLQKIYTGEYKNWKDVGGEDSSIQAFQRPLNSGSQTLFLNLLMKGLTPKKPLKNEEPAEMDGLIDVIASYNNSKNAIGYSVFYYAKKMYEVPGLKLISVDGVMPSDESIGSNKYPFLNKFYVVIREDANNATKKLYDYILSDKGKEALIKAGYIPAM